MWQTFENLLSHPASDHCLLEFFLLLPLLILKDSFMHLPKVEHILINYVAHLINVFLLFLKYLFSYSNISQR